MALEDPKIVEVVRASWLQRPWASSFADDRVSLIWSPRSSAVRSLQHRLWDICCNKRGQRRDYPWFLYICVRPYVVLCD